jgi:hypothetical protein
MLTRLTLLFAVGVHVAAAYCPSVENARITPFEYGKAYVQFLELAGQSFDKNLSMARTFDGSLFAAKDLRTQIQLDSYATMMLSLKQQNEDLRCASDLVGSFSSSKQKGIESSVPLTQGWIAGIMAWNEQLIRELKTALSNASRGEQDLGRIVDEVTTHGVKTGALWGQLTDNAVITSYAFVDLDGDPNSKTDSLNITAPERKQLISLLTRAFPGIQTASKGGRFPPEAAAKLLHIFLNRTDLRSAPARR